MLPLGLAGSLGESKNGNESDFFFGHLESTVLRYTLMTEIKGLATPLWSGRQLALLFLGQQ